MWKGFVYLIRLPLYFIPFLVGMILNFMVVLPLNILLFILCLIWFPVAAVFFIANNDRNGLDRYLTDNVVGAFAWFKDNNKSLVNWYFLLN
jgi:hypothetical protein